MKTNKAKNTRGSGDVVIVFVRLFLVWTLKSFRQCKFFLKIIIIKSLSLSSGEVDMLIELVHTVVVCV